MNDQRFCFHCGQGSFFYLGFDDDVEEWECDVCGHIVSSGVIAMLDELGDDELGDDELGDGTDAPA